MDPVSKVDVVVVVGAAADVPSDTVAEGGVDVEGDAAVVAHLALHRCLDCTAEIAFGMQTIVCLFFSVCCFET